MRCELLIMNRYLIFNALYVFGVKGLVFAVMRTFISAESGNYKWCMWDVQRQMPFELGRVPCVDKLSYDLRPGGGDTHSINSRMTDRFCRPFRKKMVSDFTKLLTASNKRWKKNHAKLRQYSVCRWSITVIWAAWVSSGTLTIKVNFRSIRHQHQQGFWKALSYNHNHQLSLLTNHWPHNRQGCVSI